MSRQPSRWWVLCLLGLCAAAAAREDRNAQKLAEMDSRLLRIERILNNQSLLELSQRSDAMQQDIRALRGQLEELQHSVEVLRNQQRDFYADLDKRLQALEGAGAPAAVSGAPPAPSASSPPPPAGGDRERAGDGPEPARAYKASLDLLKAGKYSDAATGLTKFIKDYPQSGMLDNAQYWLGEAHYVLKDYPQAVRDFQTVLEKYPSSRKIPDAMLKLGYAHYELKNNREAREILQRLAQQYADTNSGKLAQQRLAKMDAEGR